jgi:hypothetical protein
MKKYFITSIILISLGLYSSLALADDTNDKSERDKYGLIDKYGKEKIDDFYKYIYTKASSQKQVSDLDIEYKPHLDQLQKQMLDVNRSSLNYQYKENLQQKIREEYDRVLAEKSQKYKLIIEFKFLYAVKKLEDKELIESYRADVPNIDRIHQSLEIYTCAEIVGALELKSNVGAMYNEMEGSKYYVLGLNDTEKQVLASANQNRSFEYLSSIIQSEITPKMPYYLFVDKLMNYRNMIKEYANFKNDPKVMTTLKEYSQSICLPYSKYVRNGGK